MKLPRDVGGLELVKLLEKYGYRVTRQTGSHMRLRTNIKGTEHHVTIPSHNPLKTGTLSGVLGDVALYLKVEKNELIEGLFGRR